MKDPLGLFKIGVDGDFPVLTCKQPIRVLGNMVVPCEWQHHLYEWPESCLTYINEVATKHIEWHNREKEQFPHRYQNVDV